MKLFSNNSRCLHFAERGGGEGMCGISAWVGDKGRVNGVSLLGFFSIMYMRRFVSPSNLRRCFFTAAPNMITVLGPCITPNKLQVGDQSFGFAQVFCCNFGFKEKLLKRRRRRGGGKDEVNGLEKGEGQKKGERKFLFWVKTP